MIKNFLKDIIKYIPAQIVPGVVGFITIPIVTRLFYPSEYGNYSIVMATVSMLTMLVGWLSMSIIRFYPTFERNEKLDSFYGNIVKLFFVSILIISVLFCFTLLSIKQLLSNQLYKLGYIGLILFIFISLFNTLQHFLRSKRQINWYSTFAVWKSVVGVGLGLLLIIVFDFGIDGLLWGGSLSLILITPIL
ncbi:MAG: oligosaccharide flippase family protein, partial [Parcubacteria group bacterium]|nr:oligosaccharide flippase family protein [Parcubacteria group bacterium]